MDKERIESFELNKPQGDVQIVKANTTWFIAGRGTGKTTGGIGPYLLDCVQSMPKATGIIVANTYEQMLSRTLPPVVAAWANMGFREWDPVHGGHFVIGKKPPQHFDKPYIPVLKPKNFIHWYNGTVIALVSLAVKGSANALSVQFGSFDEVKFMKQDDVKEVNKVFRGNKKYFNDKSQYLSRFYATDKWADLGAIRWILSKKKLMDVHRVQVVKTLSIREMELQNILNSVENESQKEEVQRKYGKELKDISKILVKLRRNLVFYCESSAKDNMEVLGEKYFKDQKRDLSENEYNVAIENEDPTHSEGPFYPDLNESHFYDNPDDYDPYLPLIIATDYQHTIAPICVCQINNRVDKECETLNFIDSIYTLSPLKLSDAVDKFCKKYSHHKSVIYYVFDHTAKGEKAEGVPDFKTVSDTIIKAGLNLKEIYMGQAPAHFTKYIRIADWLQNKKDTPHQIRINRQRNASLKKSLELANAIIKKGKTAKDKRYENINVYPDFPQNEATHFPDVFDMILWATEELKLVRISSSGFGVAFR